jgi:hypothetical protein
MDILAYYEPMYVGDCLPREMKITFAHNRCPQVGYVFGLQDSPNKQFVVRQASPQAKTIIVEPHPSGQLCLPR